MRFWKALAVGIQASVFFALPALSAEGGADAAKKTPAATSEPAAKTVAAEPAKAEPPKEATAPAAPAPAAPAQPAASPAPAAAPTAPAAPTVDAPTYAVRLRDLEQRIDDLKEQIRRSHTRLSLLSDTILSGGGAGSRAAIRFVNDLSGAFQVSKVVVLLDGVVQYNKADQGGSLAEQEEIPIFTGSIPPGDHTLQVLVSLQGNGYGVFSYLRGYKFEVRSTHSFTAVEGKNIEVQAKAYEKGGVTTPLEQRPAVRYVEKVSNVTAEQAAPAK